MGDCGPNWRFLRNGRSGEEGWREGERAAEEKSRLAASSCTWQRPPGALKRRWGERKQGGQAGGKRRPSDDARRSLRLQGR